MDERDGLAGLFEQQLPEAITGGASAGDPQQEAELADSVGLALLVVLETLDPPERLAFVLHDMFAVPFDEIAPIVGRSPDAARRRWARSRSACSGRDASSLSRGLR